MSAAAIVFVNNQSKQTDSLQTAFYFTCKLNSRLFYSKEKIAKTVNKKTPKNPEGRLCIITAPYAEDKERLENSPHYLLHGVALTRSPVLGL